jgi:hypothetical protein
MPQIEIIRRTRYMREQVDCRAFSADSGRFGRVWVGLVNIGPFQLRLTVRR